MNGKKKAIFGGLIAAIVAVLAFALSGGAVTNAQGGLSLAPTGASDNGLRFGGTVNQGLTSLDGKIKLVATGTSVATLIVGGNGCGNAWMAWDDSPAGSAYTHTRRSSWNAPGNCGGEVLNTPTLEMWTNAGDYSSHGTLADGQTKFNEVDRTGSFTTKFQWGNVDADWAAVNLWYCGYLIPGGGGNWATGAC